MASKEYKLIEAVLVNSKFLEEIVKMEVDFNNLKGVTYKHNSVEYIQLITEAERRSYADRAYFLGDPDFNSGFIGIEGCDHGHAIKGFNSCPDIMDVFTVHMEDSFNGLHFW